MEALGSTYSCCEFLSTGVLTHMSRRYCLLQSSQTLSLKAPQIVPKPCGEENETGPINGWTLYWHSLHCSVFLYYVIHKGLLYMFIFTYLYMFIIFFDSLRISHYIPNCTWFPVLLCLFSTLVISTQQNSNKNKTKHNKIQVQFVLSIYSLDHVQIFSALPLK